MQNMQNDVEHDEMVNSCPASPCVSIDSDSLPDLDAPVCDLTAFENDFNYFNEPSFSLCGDGRVIHIPSCHPIAHNWNLRSTYEFTAMHSYAIEANFQEGHENNALELIYDFSTSVRGPTRQLVEKVLNDVLKDQSERTLKFQGYDLLMYVHQLHPPDHRLPFPMSFTTEIMEKCQALLKGGGTDASNSDIHGVILAMQYCVSSLEMELMSRKLGSRRDIGKSIISRWFNLEVSYSRVENLISWFKLAVQFDDLIRSRSRSTCDDEDADALGFHMSLLGELQKILCLAIAVSSDPTTHCARVARSFSQVMDQSDDPTEEKMLRSMSSPLLNTKVMELLSDNLTIANLSEEFGKCCTVDDIRYVADCFQAEWKVEEG
jgi:hypothetical protein